MDLDSNYFEVMETGDVQTKEKKECLPRVKGIFYLTMVIIIWVGSAILIQMIFDSDDSQYAKPLFLTYFSTSFFTLYLIPLVYELIKLKLRTKGTTTEMANSAVRSGNMSIASEGSITEERPHQ